MSINQGRVPVQESFLFMGLLTVVGGYLNAYSFMVHGAFTSLHTGNMVKMGMSVFQGQWQGALTALVPIVGNIAGAFMAELLKRFHSSKTCGVWERSSIVAELAAILIISFLPHSTPQVLANWMLSVIAGFQLSNFRSCEGTVHNTTICTGNLRTVGQYLCAALFSRNRASGEKLLRYSVTVFLFPFGAGLGAVCTLLSGRYAAALCCVALAGMLWLLYREPIHAVA